MIIVVFFIVHWYVSLFFQSFFNHRYAAHRQFTMSPFWEKVFFVMTWLTNGSSYLSPRVYGILHRMHHAFTDTEKDPHSPAYSDNIMDMMLGTHKVYSDISYGRIEIEEKFTKNVPDWKGFDSWADGRLSRLFWIIAYIGFYAAFVGSSWWLWFLLPLTCIMGPLHGVIINWFAHKIGYRNYETNNTSTNLMPIDLFMMGEGFHNNHHKAASNPNFGHRWYELDPVYPMIRLLNWLGIIKLGKEVQTELQAEQSTIFEMGKAEWEKLKVAYQEYEFSNGKWKGLSEDKLKQYLEAWNNFNSREWKNDLTAYLENIEIRKELEAFMETTNANLKKKIAEITAPADKLFREKIQQFQAMMLISGQMGPFAWERPHGRLQLLTSR